MKNEIGRKLTSLTIMAIMFAGGMAIGVPSFMPEAASDLSVTSGLLTVSTTTLQGAAILEIVVNDPDNSDTTVDLAGISASVGGTSYDLNQASNGKWYVYVVDKSQSVLMDGDDNGMEFGFACDSHGIGVSESATSLIVGTGTAVWATAIASQGDTATGGDGSCLDLDGARGTTDDTSGTTERSNLTEAVLQNAPSLSDHNDAGTDLGQMGHKLNASGYGSWPYIVSVDLNDDNVVEYGSDSINVVFGNTDDETSISLANRNPGDRTEIHLTITDPALNVDPTTADKWIFDLGEAVSATTVIFGNNGTNNKFTPAELGEFGCVNNCQLTSDSEAQLASGGGNGVSAVVMTESGANTGVFESFDINGAAEFETKAEASADTKIVFSYGGNSVDMIITYNDAAISLDAGGDWSPGQSATISVNDPDQNRNPTSAETLAVGDETAVIPTIKMGDGGLTLAEGTNLVPGPVTASATSAKATVGNNALGSGIGAPYTINLYNTTDNSERLRIIHSAHTGNPDTATVTWINVTTGHTVAQLINLAGTVVLSYDVSAPADLVSSTAISVYVGTDGNNSTDQKAGVIDVNTDGNAKSGVYDLAGSSGYGSIVNTDISDATITSGTASTATTLRCVCYSVIQTYTRSS